jgi:hypothetical protein
MTAGTAFTRYAAFGWVVHHKEIPSGEKYVVNLTRDTDGPGLGNITLVTKGRIAGVNRGTGVPIADRTPGYTNKDRTGLPAGIYDFTAQENSEWWCINQKTNRNRRPDVGIFAASMGQVVELPVGTKLLLCQGSLSVGDAQYDAPQAFQVSSQQTVFVAGEQCYGFIFKE